MPGEETLKRVAARAENSSHDTRNMGMAMKEAMIIEARTTLSWSGRNVSGWVNMHAR